MLQIVGAGMPRTGTATLCEALRILGYNAIHHEPERMTLWPKICTVPFHVFDDVDAVTDAPAAMYWRELRRVYGCKVILTVRDEEKWWESIKWHSYEILTGGDIEHIRYTEAMHGLLFGVPQPHEYWYRRRYREHNGLVIGGVPADELLIMDIEGGDRWEKLCPFLGCRVPKAEFPWKNRKTID